MNLSSMLETIVSGVFANWRGTKRGAGYVSQASPPITKWVMEGKVWKVQDLTTTACLNNVMATTTSGLTVQNPAGSGKYYVVLGVSSIADVFEAAALVTYSINHCCHAAAVVPYTRDTALTAVGGMKCGQGAYGGQVILDRAASVVDNGWSPIGNTEKSILNAQTWNSSYIALDVPVIIPPGLHYSLAATADTATVEVGLGLVWAEVDADELE